MAFRNIMITGEANLTTKHKQMCVKTEKISDSIPVEDIDTLLIESRRSTLSAALLGALAESGAAVFVCDQHHMPCGILLPYSQHSRQLEVTKQQLDMTTPTKKQLWKQVIIAKINNQAMCLTLCGKDKAKELESIAKTVKSGDSGHAESHSAAKYFTALFGKGFTRGNEADCRNAWLNYGYAILRGCVARTLAVYGFFQAYGLHHHSALNQFNLADDFMEPFRPLIDLFVAQHCDNDSELNPYAKRLLFSLVYHNIQMDGKKYALTYAIERMVQSFSSVVTGKKKDLLLPQLMKLEQHAYE